MSRRVMIRVTLTLDEETLAILEEEAARSAKTAQQVVRAVIREFMAGRRETGKSVGLFRRITKRPGRGAGRAGEQVDRETRMAGVPPHIARRLR